MAKRLVLVKLAAIGDVAIAARALREFLDEREVDLEVEWIIDRGLAGLASSLLDRRIRCHAIDATALFTGSLSAKARQTASMLKIVAAARPDHLMLLHRDWRYRALLTPFAGGRLIAIDRAHSNELAIYRKAFAELGSRLPPTPRRAKPAADRMTARSGRIGLLVGGARNQKVDFAEKRWPKLHELARLLLEKTPSTLVLFGGTEDLPAAASLVAATGSTDRIESLVGKTPLDALPSAIAGLDSFVSIDSGLAHIAAAVMTQRHQKIVTLFGPTDPTSWAPTPSGLASVRVVYKAPPCSPCYSGDGVFRPCRFEGALFQHCMTSIEAEDVLRALE